ncbi:hypothetical Protein YC6258_03156 [Gynuella sunshinyii YC6258]|uniref:Uncharacterized protein n=1 Tax=Gynuella sunshinyii YC6258 TaxID=1445510 RepID=A0A0C5VKH6_9GAMM|nr:hypothetical Protein YC6258_03156 [Gynuella sunshinyii YC6258]
MGTGDELYAWSQQHVIADSYGCRIQKDTIKIGIETIADMNVTSIIKLDAGLQVTLGPKGCH